MWMHRTLGILITVFMFVNRVTAEQADLAELARKIEALTQTVEKLQQGMAQQQQEIVELKSENQRLRDQLDSGAAAVTAMPLPEPQARSIGLNALNPEIGVVGDVVGYSSQGDEDDHGNDKISVRELELVFGSDIDPYSRFDATLAYSDYEDMHIEEAYITHWGLSEAFNLKLGRMRNRVGKSTLLHLHQLDTVDQPLVVQEYLGEEGLFRSGLEISAFAPWDSEIMTQEISLGVIEGQVGHGGTLFTGERRQPSLYGNLRNFFDISDFDTFELGASYLVGASDPENDFNVQAVGLNAEYSHYFTANRHLKLLAEGYWQDRNRPADQHDHDHDVDQDQHQADNDDSDLMPFNRNPFGSYLLADFKFSPSWNIGGRYDYLEPVNLDFEGAGDATTGGTAYLTYHQSEYLRWRFQYQYLDLVEGGNDNRFFLQASATIGVHKHPLQ